MDSAAVIGSHFTDSGLFGLKLQGPGSHCVDLLSVACDEISKLRDPISESELRRAKNITKMNILSAMERQEDRLEELARNYMTFGEINLHRYCENIDKVSSKQINQMVTKMLKGKPTMCVIGANVNEVPTLEQIKYALH